MTRVELVNQYNYPRHGIARFSMMQLAKEVVMKVGHCMCEAPSSKPGESEEETLTNYSMTPALATPTIVSSVTASSHPV